MPWTSNYYVGGMLNSNDLELLTTSEIEELTGGAFQRRTTQRLVREGLLKAPVVVRCGRKILINKAEFIEWLANGGTATVEPGVGP